MVTWAPTFPLLYVDLHWAIHLRSFVEDQPVQPLLLVIQHVVADTGERHTLKTALARLISTVADCH